MCYTRRMTTLVRGLALLIAVLVGGRARAEDAKPLILWHTLDARSGHFLETLVAEFNGQSRATPVRTETGMDLQQALIEGREEGGLPDVVLAPSDLIGLASELALSEVPAELAGDAAVRATVAIRGKAFGVPLVDGNHLMLLYNKRLTTVPPATLEGVGLGGLWLGWMSEDPYVIATFLNAFDGFPVTSEDGIACGKPAFAEALSAYKALLAARVGQACDYHCVTQRFYAGEVAAVLNGDWALVDAAAALGDDLGIAPLPTLAGRRLVSLSATHALLFPGKSLAGPNRATLLALARYLQSPPIQRRWLTEGRRLPVDPLVQQELSGPAKAALEALKSARRMPTSATMALAWPVLRKGLRLFMLGVKDAGGACDYMHDLFRLGAAERAP